MSDPNSGKDPKRKTLLCQEIDGYKVAKGVSVDAFKSALAYKPRSDDICLVSYPKCGNTWMHLIVTCILGDGKPFTSHFEYYMEAPFLHVTGAEVAEKLKRPGLIKFHFPFHMTPWSPDAKYIFIARNPKDVCVSYYHHMAKIPAYQFEDGTFDDFFELFMTGEVLHGDYFDTTLSWYEHRNDPNVLFITFEDLRKDTVKNILKIAAFIGSKYKEKLETDDKLLQDVIRHSSLSFAKENMRRIQTEGKGMTEESIRNNPNMTAGAKSVLLSFREYKAKTKDDDSTILVREGKVGNWRNCFSPSQNARLEKKFREKFAGTGLLELWKEDM